MALALAGCAGNDDYYAAMDAAMTHPGGSGTNAVPADVLHVGDDITVSFDGVPDPDLAQPQTKTINEDGTITLPDINSVKAAGKTTGQLADAIHDLYVPRFYTHLTVTVKAGDRVYYVRGEVGNPGRQIYVGQTTVTKAITSAGDFNDFANRKNVILIRSNGQRFKLNCAKILDGEAPDPPVYPGDLIEVRRRIF